MTYEPHHCLNFRINDHNVDYFVEAFSKEEQPTQLLVPCDYDGNEIVVPAPSSWVVEREILYHDVRESLGNSDLIVSLKHRPLYHKMGQFRVVDPSNRHPILFEPKEVMPSLTDIITKPHPEEIYLFSTTKQGHIERLNGLVKKLVSGISDGGYFMQFDNHGDGSISLLERIKVGNLN